MNLYDVNKIAYASLPTMTKEDLEKSYDVIFNFLKDNPSKYYLMLNNESKYYTVYTFKSDPNDFSEMARTIMEIAEELGEIKSIEVTTDKGAIEFWIIYEDECRVFYLFNYAQGVVEI